ncbi:hypothetical protein, partial [Pseudomonas syringae group genomosp. 7]|uniref:hypothetical protein n=1 Tax=Pseudomonas syringae group genomosp. 7 TaxID=251699 RepID=UPI00376F785C
DEVNGHRLLVRKQGVHGGQIRAREERDLVAQGCNSGSPPVDIETNPNNIKKTTQTYPATHPNETFQTTIINNPNKKQ